MAHTQKRRVQIAGTRRFLKIKKPRANASLISRRGREVARGSVSSSRHL